MKKKKILYIAVILLLLLATIVQLAICVWSLVLLLSFGFSGDLFSYFFVLPLGLSSFLLFNIKNVYLRSKGTSKSVDKFSWQCISLVLASILSLLIVFIACSFAYMSFTDRPPQFFSLDDETSTYTIVRDSNSLYEVSYHSLSSEAQMKVLVGQSLVELDPYVNKSVHLTGEFVYGHKQCMPTKCISIPNSALFNIHSIK